MAHLLDMLTSRAKGVIRKLSPSAVWRAAERRMVSNSRPGDALARALSTLPVESIIVRGAQGVFEGSAADVSIIQRYAVEQVWSAKTLDLVLAFFNGTPGTYVDIGANIGLTAVPVAAARIRTLAFEPVPKNFSYLTRNIALNDVSGHIDAFNLALLDQAGEITFELSPTNHGDHRFRRGEAISRMGENEWVTVKVKGSRLDDFLDRVEGLLVVKIDTQGSEPLVIEGGRNLLDRASLVICEFSPYAMTRMKTDAHVVSDYFSRFNKVDVYEGESEDIQWTLSGEALRSFLDEYYEQHKDKPYRRYLNLIGMRSSASSA